MGLPVNFEDKVRQPPAQNGTGYPYRISAKDLMKDFVYAAVEVPENIVGGVRNGIKVTNVTGEGGHAGRAIFAEAFPEGAQAGDVMVYDGAQWVLVDAPSGSGVHVLSRSGSTVSWLATEECA